MRRGPAVLNGRVFMWACAGALLFLGLILMVAPVFAQSNANAGDNVEYNAVCQNIIGSIGDINQSQTGNANANADSDAVASGDTTGGTNAESSAEAVAEVAQEQNVSIAQVNECLNQAAATPDGNTTPDGDTTPGGDTPPRADTTSIVTPDVTTSRNGDRVPVGVIVNTIPDQKVLANTGGPFILLPALGLLFVTGGATLLTVLLRR